MLIINHRTLKAVLKEKQKFTSKNEILVMKITANILNSIRQYNVLSLAVPNLNTNLKKT